MSQAPRSGRQACRSLGLQEARLWWELGFPEDGPLPRRDGRFSAPRAGLHSRHPSGFTEPLKPL